MSQSLADNLGAVFIGVIFSSILFGITNLQTYIYYCRYPKDWYIHKISIGILWALDAVHLALTVDAVYQYLINGFGNVLALLVIVWSFKLQIAVNIVIILFVQSLYAMRIWKLGRGHRHTLLPCLVTFVVVAGYVVGILLVIETFRMTTWAELDTISWAIYASFATSTGVDFVIAAVMCYYLHKSKSGFTGSENIINRLMQYTLSSGLVTSACSMSALIAYALMPTNLIFLAIEFSLTKLYINSFLAMLNARQNIRERDRLSISLSKLRSSNYRGGLSLPSASTSFASPSTPVGGTFDQSIKIQTIPESPMDSKDDFPQLSPQDGKTHYQWSHINNFQPRAV
ncbi:hypothetical protein SERLA73DRAFT_143687 [Serpula lacrymans var. lacrymans S7.3]|uniref:DUF6534 domain-containing protein n=2 Tax=Serpula lacrymans var. lacrymans TaxID=341189 RepID=F8QAM5_SERL3|nr:uncharacterized protein SERLADRAFT_400545 [Serpula lacrymans var. lacrymans S7.9]EGN94815.1 hypothetical protein SERLA73DRAFT_143687 [Serpula lacrymans var. lacrymans S7.3]EGO20314.1 hypothetical protein SERLADRAFT_400545 [Serpula lacrymans var. lacrymans S7.9]